MRFAVVALLCATGLGGCSPAPVITITNRAPVTLTNVVVSGTGFSQRVDNIAAGAQRLVTVKPRGESGLRIRFDAGNTHVDVADLAYLEGHGGYRVAVTIAPDLQVSAQAQTGGY